MPDLAAFQLAFAAAVDRGGAGGGLESQPGFAVYRNTTPNALIGVLRSVHPVTAQILGDAAFDELAFGFARRNPPTSPVLAHYGGGFADHVEAQPWAGELPYLADVARIEWLRAEAHVAADSPALALADVAALGADGLMALRLPLHPAARTAWLATPAVTIWQAHVDGFDSLAPDWRAEGVLVARPDDHAAVHRIGPAEHRLICGLRLGETVGAAAAAAGGVHPEADFATAFATLVGRGAFARPPSLERTH